MYKYIETFIIILITNQIHSQYVPYNCKTNEGKKGMCKMNCKTARYFNRTPTLCGHLDRTNGQDVICCTDINALIIKEPIDFHYPGMKINNKKCLEYTAELKRLKSLKNEIEEGSALLCLDGICHYQDFIIGGNNAAIDEFPHMAQLGWEKVDGKGYDWKCGGSLISEDFVLTAAHCLYIEDSELISPEPTRVRMGGRFPKEIQISTLISHSDYRPPKKYNDIALAKLAESVVFSLQIRPACIWSESSLSGDAVTIGWGATSSGGDRAENLQKVTLNIYEDTECKRGYRISRNQPQGIAESQFCAGYPLGGRDACQGDSGGPIQVKNKENNEMFDVIGITSFGSGCGSAKGGVYTRISHYVDWIEKNVWTQ